MPPVTASAAAGKGDLGKPATFVEQRTSTVRSSQHSGVGKDSQAGAEIIRALSTSLRLWACQASPSLGGAQPCGKYRLHDGPYDSRGGGIDGRVRAIKLYDVVHRDECRPWPFASSPAGRDVEGLVSLPRGTCRRRVATIVSFFASRFSICQTSKPSSPTMEGLSVG
jgi:hypothetical protein